MTLRLAAEGYRVWCDRVKLLGGESYPRDIDRAIKDQAFRMLAVMSRHSVNKPNPLKERTLGLNLARERGEEFLIPLNLDGLSASELPWMVSDLTYVPFYNSWAEGLAQLLKKLRSVDAPQPLANGKEAVSTWLAEKDSVSHAPERLWTNLLEIQALPTTLLRLTLAQPVPDGVAVRWPHYRESDTVLWAFEGPEVNGALELDDVDAVDWSEDDHGGSGLRLNNVVTALLKRHLRHVCVSRGLRESPDRRYLYFPPDLLPDNRLIYTGYDGRQTWIQAVGDRSIRLSRDQREHYRYHLSPSFTVELFRYGTPMIEYRTRLYLTDLDGKPLPGPRIPRRRKNVTRGWWNHQWVCRLLAIAGWLADGRDEISLSRTKPGLLALAARPLALAATAGIDELSLGPLEVDEVLERLDRLRDEDEADLEEADPTIDDENG